MNGTNKVPAETCRYRGWTIRFRGESRLKRWENSWEAESNTGGHLRYHFHRGESGFLTKDEALADAYAEAQKWIDAELAKSGVWRSKISANP